MKPRKLPTSRAAVIMIAAGVWLVAACSANAAPSGSAAAGPAGAAGSSSAAGRSGGAGRLGAPAIASVPAGPTAVPHVSTAPAGTEVTGTLANGTTWVAEYPQSWNGTLILYSHGYGALTAADAPDQETQQALLGQGFALAGSSFDPNGSEWALNTAVSDQFGALTAVESTVLPRLPAHVIAFGTSMGGLVSALEAQQGQGRIAGALTTCGVVAGGVSLNDYQLDGEYAIAQLLGNPATPLVGLDDDTAESTTDALTADADQAQGSAAGQARLALAMAFLNMPAWDPSSYAPAPAGQPAAEEAAQYAALTGDSDNAIDFMVGGRVSIEQAAGGQAASDAGTNFAQALAGSPYLGEVKALYQAAGLNLGADLATLTAHATVKADPAALAALRASSDPTGKLAVPELDLHTVGDNLVPVGQENDYARLVGQAGDSGLLRQAYTESPGHCNFSVSEQVAGIKAVLQRVTSGQWGEAATPASLQRAAGALGLDPAHFTAYSPGALTGAVPAN
jgi:alpha-beta hydrolase superfamily lysophospholipase